MGFNSGFKRLTSATGDGSGHLHVPIFLTPWKEAQTPTDKRVGGPNAGLDKWQMIKASIHAGNRTTMPGSPAP